MQTETPAVAQADGATQGQSQEGDQGEQPAHPAIAFLYTPAVTDATKAVENQLIESSAADFVADLLTKKLERAPSREAAELFVVGMAQMVASAKPLHDAQAALVEAITTAFTEQYGYTPGAN
jgi:hypothetical protein